MRFARRRASRLALSISIWSAPKKRRGSRPPVAVAAGSGRGREVADPACTLSRWATPPPRAGSPYPARVRAARRRSLRRAIISITWSLVRRCTGLQAKDGAATGEAEVRAPCRPALRGDASRPPGREAPSAPAPSVAPWPRAPCRRRNSRDKADGVARLATRLLLRLRAMAMAVAHSTRTPRRGSSGPRDSALALAPVALVGRVRAGRDARLYTRSAKMASSTPVGTGAQSPAGA
mmetsp:Transcript_136/g.292  ORF Transcript_136/g.292 Transcript_136/m.292 type:complete len:235 (-) Transcript_136:793-1497(-)